MDYKYLSYAGLKRFFYTKILKQINLKIDKINGDISNTKVRSVDTISTEFPDPIAGESTKTFLGKVKKCLADWKAIKSTLLTLSMLTSQYENSTSKIPTSALVYALKQSLDTTNSNLTPAGITKVDAGYINIALAADAWTGVNVPLNNKLSSVAYVQVTPYAENTLRIFAPVVTVINANSIRVAVYNQESTPVTIGLWVFAYGK